ncbi:MAG: hypothetical protein IJU38_10685 [Clostridia bacterium]|jgi:hypothetical protein|nr:hypothetical protein [Clostridia bacterium]
MDNKQIYKATLCFSIRRVLWDLLALLVWAGVMALGFFIAEKAADKGLIGLAIGGVIGLIALVFFLRWLSYKYKAGQIAMMTKGITEGELPQDVMGEGQKIVKERFATVAAFFAVTRVIKAIFNQLGRGISAAGRAIGGDTGGTAGDVISSVIQVIVSYLCDCCLGWVFYRKDVKATKATCEGAVLFFKHGKTFFKNMGRVFGMGLATLAVIGGAFAGIFYLIASRFPAVFDRLYVELAESSTKMPEWLNSPTILMIAASVIGGLIVWAFFHSLFIRPFVLVGVLRNYIQSGINDIPTEESFAVLDGKSEKFKKLHQEAA